MKTARVISLLVVFSALATTNAFNKLTPLDKEAIFTWKADIKAAQLQMPDASQFVLQGKVHLQSKNDTIFVKIANLTHRIYNGIFDNFHEHEARDLPVPEEVHDLYKVFKIVYNDGLVEGIATEKDEKEFSRNIKKAIATVLQMKSTDFSRVLDHPESVLAKENSIYGYGDDFYSIYYNGHEIELHKLHEMGDPLDTSPNFISNIESDYCDVKHEQTVMHDRQKKYVLVKENDRYVVKHITATASIVYHPFRAKSDTQTLRINQTFELMEVVPIEEEFHVEAEHFEKSLVYRPFEDVVVNYDKLIPMVRTLLEDIPRYLQEDHMHNREPDIKRGQLVNRVQRILLQFTVTKLQELKTVLPEEALEVFYHILPLVGTEASTLYIKTLIVEKTLSEEIAVDLLQLLVENARPSVPLLKNLEDLLYLNETFTWNLRKVSILSFGSLIHKSFIHHNSEEPYVKYVDEYILKLRQSSSYKTQVTYLLGLRNMKLPMLAQRLVPAFNGEWWSNQHLRYMAIWAASPSTVFNKDPNVIMQTFWPIFANRQELTSLRGLTYYFLMYSRISLARMRNLFVYMLTEPDEELYRIHYTLSRTVMQSTDPCHQELRIKIAQLMKFTPPPRHGISGVNFFGYEDSEFGFSAGTQNYFLKTNESRLYAVYATSQQFQRYQEEYIFYWKVHDGRDTDSGLVPSIINIIRNGTMDGVHIEASIAKRGQVINTWAFDRSNLVELVQFFETFGKDVSISKNLLRIAYDRYHSALIPTDLGIPALWEYVMPTVHYNKLKVSKEVVGDDVNIQVDSKYVNWVHYRHGLTFYNPISDVWQGINRYHSYNALVPLHFNISFNLEQKTFELFWKKHSDPQMNVFGFRSHVKHVVFAGDRDDQEEQVLEEFVPHGEEFQPVGNGKQYRHDYPLIEEEHEDTGYKLQISYYDSNKQFSFGIFKNQIFTFAQTPSKYFSTPIEHWALVWQNFHRHIVLLPRSGMYGFFAKAEPNPKLNVTNIDLILRLKVDPKSNNTYLPGTEWNSLLRYVAKNENQVLKAWDLKTLLVVQPGHNLANLRTELTRIVPGQKDYKVLLEAYKLWKPRKVVGYLNATMGYGTEIEVVMEGRGSEQQKNKRHKYATCQHTIPYSGPKYHSIECLVSHSTLRHYIFDVKATNVPSDFVKYWDSVKSHYQSYSSYKKKVENVTDNSFRVEVVFPMQAHEINIEVSTPQSTYEFSGVPLTYLENLGFTPDSTIYSRSFLNRYKQAQADHCVIYYDHYFLNRRSASEVVPDNWTLYVDNVENQICIKHVNRKIALKLTDYVHTFEIVPLGDNYQIVLDGTVSGEEQHQEDWINYHVFAEDSGKPVAVLLQKNGIHFEYDLNRVVIVLPRRSNVQGTIIELQNCYEMYKMEELFIHPSANNYVINLDVEK